MIFLAEGDDVAGADAYDLLVVSLKADVDVAFERIDFKRAKARAFDMRGFGNVSPCSMRPHAPSRRRVPATSR